MVVGSIPGQGIYQRCVSGMGYPSLDMYIPSLGTDPSLGTYQRQQINTSLLHQYFSLSLPLSLKAVKKMSMGEDNKIIKIKENTAYYMQT